MYMRTKRIIAKCEQHSGYGAGAGDTEYYEYECPCGKGTIIEEHDNIPGFREHSVYLHCTTCTTEYIIDTSAGTRNWKIVRKKVTGRKLNRIFVEFISKTLETSIQQIFLLAKSRY